MPAGATTSRGALPGTAPSEAEEQKQRPRLLVVTPDFPPQRGGIQALMGGLVAHLDGFDRRLVTLDSPQARDHDAGLAFPVRRVAAPGGTSVARNLALNAAALGEARRFAPAVCLAGHIVTSPATAVLARLSGVPTAQYFHANEIGHRPRLAAFAARTAAVSIVVSSYTLALLGGVEPRPGDVRLIPPGIELPGRAGEAVAADPPTFLTVSRLAAAYKGHDVLLQALPAVLARVPDAQWVVIGDGPLRAALEERARAAGLSDSVRFLGAVPDAERDRWLERADVFAMPSRLPGGRLAGEGFGIAYMEAAARGTPALAGDVGGAVDAVVHGETGVRVDPADAAAVADALATLLSDRELARRLGAAAAARAREFAWPAIAARVQTVLLELVRRGAS